MATEQNLQRETRKYDFTFGGEKLKAFFHLKAGTYSKVGVTSLSLNGKACEIKSFKPYDDAGGDVVQFVRSRKPDYLFFVTLPGNAGWWFVTVPRRRKRSEATFKFGNTIIYVTWNLQRGSMYLKSGVKSVRVGDKTCEVLSFTSGKTAVLADTVTFKLPSGTMHILAFCKEINSWVLGLTRWIGNVETSKDNLNTWTVNEVSAWMENIPMVKEFKEHFLENGVDGKALETLFCEEEHLDDLLQLLPSPVPRFKKRRLLDEIQKLARSSPSGTPTDAGQSDTESKSPDVPADGGTGTGVAKVLYCRDFSDIKNLSGGHFSMTYLAKWNSFDVVCKVSKQPNHSDWFEFKILSNIPPHDNFLSIIGICTNFKIPPKFDSEKIAIVVERLDGSLKEYLDKVKEPIGHSQMFKYALDMAQGIHHLHANGYIHRDIAARNFLMKRDQTIVLADFGLSRPTDEVYTAVYETSLPWRYVPIETLETLQSSTKSDVWMYGIALWEILVAGTTLRRELPFDRCRRPDELKALLLQSNGSKDCKLSGGSGGSGVPLRFPEDADKDFVDLIKLCCVVNADKRSSIDEIIHTLSGFGDYLWT